MSISHAFYRLDKMFKMLPNTTLGKPFHQTNCALLEVKLVSLIVLSFAFLFSQPRYRVLAYT